MTYKLTKNLSKSKLIVDIKVILIGEVMIVMMKMNVNITIYL